MDGFGHPFGVWHHAQHIAACVQHTRNVASRTIDVFGVTEGNTAFALKSIKRFTVGEIIAVVMRNGNLDKFIG
jgi:peptidase E